MAYGWTKDGDENAQERDFINDAIALARAKLPKGESLEFCEECDEEIPEARRKALPGVRLCVSCQSKLEKRENQMASYNRRGSADSQIK